MRISSERYQSCQNKYTAPNNKKSKWNRIANFAANIATKFFAGGPPHPQEDKLDDSPNNEYPTYKKGSRVNPAPATYQANPINEIRRPEIYRAVEESKEALQSASLPHIEDFWEGLARASQYFIRALRIEGLLFLLQLGIFSLLLQNYLPALSRYYFDQSATVMLHPGDLEQILSDDSSSPDSIGGGENLPKIALAGIENPLLELSKEQLEAVLNPEYLTQSYTVENGENISLLAQRHHLKMSTLISVNQIERARSLRAGQKILIPNMDGLLYRVKQGDALKSIAQKYSTSIGSLIDTNQLQSETLVAGSQIFIPGATLSSYELRKVFGNLFIYPVKGRFSSYFGYRKNPFRRNVREFHNGLDIVGPRGAAIKASADGVVVATGYHHNIFGRYVILQHDKGIKTLYGHMSKILVNKGQRVIQGSTVGLIGSTGRSTGPHVHFSIFFGGKAVNPLDYLNK